VPPRTLSPVTYAAVCGSAGALISGAFVAGAGGEGWWVLVPSASVGSFCTAWLIWRTSASLHARADPAIGAILGVFTSVVAHYATWYVAIVSFWLCAVFSGDCRSSLGERPMNPLYAVVGAGVFAIWSLYLAGLASVPVGAAIGAVCSRWSVKGCGSNHRET
jgi:hypothetical protein